MATAIDELIAASIDALQFEPELTVSQWADQHRMLSGKASAEPGPWRTDRTPYLREIMDELSTTSNVQRVVLMAGAMRSLKQGVSLINDSNRCFDKRFAISTVGCTINIGPPACAIT